MRCARVLCLLFVSYFFNFCACAVMHTHSPHLNRERERDGAYSPRDKGHLSESGEHQNYFDHEAILGSAKEAEDFDHFTPEESKKRLAILLTKMDRNGDKNIDHKELKAWILRSFKMLTEEEANERLLDADEDDDGKVTWEEYVTDTYGMEDSDEKSSGENEQLMQEDRLMWKAADINGDDVLEGDEWVAFSHPEEHPAMLPYVLEQTLREKDTDGDRVISFQEYIGDRGKENDAEWVMIEKVKFDKGMDKNGNGVLDGSEILSWVVPSNEEIAEEEVIHLFAASDDDHDHLLSFEEVLTHHDIFVGSEATDFGDHLHKLHHFDDEL